MFKTKNDLHEATRVKAVELTPILSQAWPGDSVWGRITDVKDIPSS